MKKFIFNYIFLLIGFVIMIQLISCNSKKYGFVFHTNGGNTISSISMEDDNFSNFELPVPLKEGYSFDGWFLDDTFQIEYDSEKVVDGINELYAKYRINEYNIIIHGEDTLKYTYKYNDYIDCSTFPMSTDYDFYCDEEYKVLFDLKNMPAHDVNLYPKLTDNKYFKVNYFVDSNKGYLIGDCEQTVKYNNYTSEVDVRALDGFRFIGWNDGKMESKRSDLITDDLDLYAQFERTNKLTIICSNSEEGYIDGKNIQTLSLNESASIVKAVPNLGYKFQSWSNGELSDTLSVGCIKEDTTIYANFTIDNMELPIMEINTFSNQPIDQKETYIDCNVSVSNANYQYTFRNQSAGIQGRGNTTWLASKNHIRLSLIKK